MAESGGKYGWFKMKQLPKPEYTLLKELIEAYSLKDASEAVTVLLALAYEVRQLKDAHIADGAHWIVQVIDHVRSRPESARQYTLV